MKLLPALLVILVPALAQADDPGLRAAYDRATNWQKRADNSAFKLTIDAHWLDNHRFWYRNALKDSVREYWLVDAEKATKSHPFDQIKLAAALAETEKSPIEAAKLELELNEVTPDRLVVTHLGKRYSCTLPAYKLELIGTAGISNRQGPANGADPSATPRRRARANNPNLRLQDGQLEVKDGANWTAVTKLGSYQAFTPNPTDANKVLALRVLPGDHRKLYLLHSTGAPGKTRATLEERLYDQPGDQLDRFEPVVVDLAAKTEIKVAMDPIDGGSYPWPGPPNVETSGPYWLLPLMVRGNQEYKILRVDSQANVFASFDEKVPTFIDISHTAHHFFEQTPEFLAQSERSGWSRLYLIKRDTAEVERPVTPDGGVFRSLLRLDEAKREIIFMGNGYEPGEDPYQQHAYKASLETGAVTKLTPADGAHTVRLSTDGDYLIDTYSRVDRAPIHELRNAKNGKLIMELERADVTALVANGVPRPARFVAKARDGQTDIWGVVFKPSDFDPKKRYPIIENIYAGPHDSFVPKTFQPIYNMQRLAELGFIVVQIDGMGTNNRGKKFHDVCWKNLADGGFPDRILWMKALAKKIPQIDLTKVGVYGTSAGGQDAANAVLFHPEFYTAAVASCGCYDNRVDKQWWNEQWMGYPVGPHYAEQAAVNHVQSLKGHLMLFVSEDDHNVPPESTFQLVDALIKAKKEFDMLVLPALDHSDGGPYGERKRRDFFVRWLLGKEPPDWNES